MLKKISFHWKLYITYSIIISFLLAAALFAFYQYNSGLLEKNMEEASLNSLEVSEERLNDFLGDMDQHLSFFHTLPDFMKYAEAMYEEDGMEDYFVWNPMKALEIQRIFLSVLVNERSQGSISYISRDYNNIHASVTGDYQESLENKMMRECIDVNEIFLSGENSRYIFPHYDFWSLQEEQVISVYHPVRDMFQTYGLLVYDKNVEELNTILSVGDDEVFLIDRDADCWYSNKTGSVDKTEKEILRAIPEKGETGFLETRQNHSYYYSHSQLTGWTMVLKKDVAFYVREKDKLENTILLIFFAGIVLILCLIYVVSQNLSAPLKKLKRNLENQSGNSFIQLEVTTDNNEITMLSTAIEQFLNQIQTQNKNLLAAKELALNAHFKAMEAQLNPHFLYNTLSVIGTYGLEKGDDAVAYMCKELSNLLRYSMTYNNKAVRLADEIENVKSYLYIMQMRYEHMLESVVETDSDIGTIMVPKLILQPIVENCFKHGFKDVPPIWKIRLRFWHTTEKWYVSVSNNGSLMADDKADELRRLWDNIRMSFHNDMVFDEFGDEVGLGLKNTVIRLHMYYQGKEHFRFFVEDGMTVIELGGCIHEG